MDANRRLKRWRLDTVADVEFKAVIWEPQQNAECWKARAENVTTMIRQIGCSEYEKTFQEGQLAMLVFDSNRMEGTIPIQFQQGPTLKRIRQLMSTDMPEPPIVEWCSEGGRGENCQSSDRQLF